jgi:chromosome segregation ATPase
MTPEMSRTPPDGPRYLHERAAPGADSAASVDVNELLASLAEQAEELAEARVRRQAAEADLKRTTQEMGAECKAQREARERLETDCHELAAECRELEAEVARERQALTAVEADFSRVKERAELLQHQLKIAWGQLKQGGAAPDQGPWWSRLGQLRSR